MCVCVDPDKTVKENFRYINENLIKPNKSRKVQKVYENCLIAECTLDDCHDLLVKFVNGEGSTVSYTINIYIVLHTLYSLFERER